MIKKGTAMSQSAGCRAIFLPRARALRQARLLELKLVTMLMLAGERWHMAVNGGEWRRMVASCGEGSEQPNDSKQG
jgi:hypothetical protein